MFPLYFHTYKYICLFLSFHWRSSKKLQKLKLRLNLPFFRLLETNKPSFQFFFSWRSAILKFCPVLSELQNIGLITRPVDTDKKVKKVAWRSFARFCRVELQKRKRLVYYRVWLGWAERCGYYNGIYPVYIRLFSIIFWSLIRNLSKIA